MRTPGTRTGTSGTPRTSAQAQAGREEQSTALKRFGEHSELANLAAFLVSDAATYINGECITIDGAEWMASGGEFNGLTALPREELKEGLRKLRPR